MSAKKYTVDSIGPRLADTLGPLLKRAGFDLSYAMVETESVHPEYESPEVTVQFKGPDVDLLLAVFNAAGIPVSCCQSDPAVPESGVGISIGSPY